MADLAAMAALENANKVWQRVNDTLAGGTAAVPGASPLAQKAFRDLKLWLATQKGNPDLRFTRITSELLLTANDGLGVGIGVTKIYGIYLKKRITNGTDAFFQVIDEGTDANIYGGALTASIVMALPFLLASDEAMYLNPVGLSILVGLRFASTTTAIGTTASTLAATSMDGFAITGA